MPLVLGGLHYLVSGLVFLGRLVILSRFLVKRTEVGVAERYAEVASGFLVQRHGAPVTDPR